MIGMDAYSSRVPRRPDKVTIGALLREGPSERTMWSFIKSGVILSFVDNASRGNNEVA